ncbi:MAG: zincin-like metallopeptidase domain-containing protein, partial [Pseudomonadota bacterium]
IPYAKSYRVFNAEQIDGLPESYQTQHEAPRDLGTEADPELDAWFARTGIRIETISEPRAYYAPGPDKIHMPPIATFLTAHGFYQTLSHESLHGSGHAKRLDRLKAANTKAEYAREELVAEIGAAMLCATLGIHLEIEQNAAYVEGWLKALQEDKREIFRAASAAQKGCDWLIEAASEEAAEAA